MVVIPVILMFPNESMDTGGVMIELWPFRPLKELLWLFQVPTIYQSIQDLSSLIYS